MTNVELVSIVKSGDVAVRRTLVASVPVLRMVIMPDAEPPGLRVIASLLTTVKPCAAPMIGASERAQKMDMTPRLKTLRFSASNGHASVAFDPQTTELA